jgi:MFS family permease
MSGKRVFRGWRVVIGSGFGIAFGSAVFIASSFGLLAAAIAAQFGWSQTDVAKGASIFLLLQMFTYPVVGWFLDRFGSHRVAMVSIVLFAASLVVLSQITNAPWQFNLAFVLIGLVSAGTNVVSYARAITLWFDRKRGLALGIAAAFQALGSFLVPIIFARVIASAGWPAAVLTLAAIEILVCLPIVALVVRDDPHRYGLHPDGDDFDHHPPTALPGEGLTLGQVARTGTFWKLSVSFAIMGGSLYAVLANIAFILTRSAGLTLSEVATVQAISGVAVLLGRAGFGYLLDKFSAAAVGIASLVLSMIFFAGYGFGSSFAVVVAAAFIGGASVGGEGDLMPYLAGRYFGKQAVSKTFGWFLSAYVFGGAIGPVAFAWAMKAFDGAALPLYGLAALQIVPIVLFLTLGPYPEQAKKPA